MRVENARRLTGRGFFLPVAGACVELWREDGDGLAGAALEAEVARRLDALLPRLGLGQAARAFHRRETGLTVSVAAPIDRLLATADALEWLGLAIAGLTELDLEAAVAAFEATLATEANAALIALERAAHERGVPLLWDEDAVSLGLGVHAEVFAARALPEPARVDAARDRAIPVGLVTGTNGKTTTTRMTAAILRARGYVVGLSSTDAIAVGDVLVERGDWTGPGAARKVLRHPSATAAVLETARGGILRRGLAYDAADGAVVTNIAADHLGDYGITELADMARVKAVVWSGVRAGGKRIAHAACPVSMAHLRGEVPGWIGGADWVLFTRLSRDALGARDATAAAELATHLARGGEAWLVEGEHIVHHRGADVSRVVAVADIPATFGGAATHNVENALAAAALASALGATHEDIARGLAGFGLRPSDNPGRLEVYEIDGVRVVLDFGHNPHGVSAVAPTVEALRGSGRLFVTTGQAGDRSDHDLASLADAVVSLRPDRVLVRQLPGYERGRSLEEVVALLDGAFAAAGIAREAMGHASSEIDAITQGLAWARPGDLVLVLVHVERDEVQAFLAERTPRAAQDPAVLAPLDAQPPSEPATDPSERRP